MKRRLIISLLCLTVLFCHGAGTKTKGFLITIHIEGQAEEFPKFATPVKLGSEYRQYYFRNMPSFTDKDIRWFYPFVSQDGQSYGAAFRLHDSKAQELTALTEAFQGRLLGTRVADAPLRAVVIDRPINDGIVVMWDGLSQAHVKLINSKIPHVDQIQSGGAPDLPTFNLPGGSTASPTSNNSPTPPTAKKNPFKFLNRKNTNSEESVNPYANTPR